MLKRSGQIRLISHVQISDYHCGPAVIQMLLENYGLTISQEKITEAAMAEETIKEHGTRIDQLALAVKSLSNELLLYYKYNSLIDDIRKLLCEFCLPVGVEWQGIFDTDDNEDNGHYSVITNVDEEKKSMIIVDPYKDYVRSDRIILISEFQKRWWDENEIYDRKRDANLLIKDNRLLFVVSPANSQLSEKLGLETFF